MSFLDIFRRKNKDGENQSKSIFAKREYSYAKLVLFYIITRNSKTNEIVAEIIEKYPENVDIIDLNHSNSYDFDSAVKKCNADFSQAIEYSSLYYFDMSVLYNLGREYDDENVNIAISKYLQLKEMVLKKCQQQGIIFNRNEQDIFSDIVNTIVEKNRSDTESRGWEVPLNLDFCRTREGIIAEQNRQLNGNNNYKNFSIAKLSITSYFTEFIQLLPWLLNILDKEQLSENEHEFLLQYAKMLEVLPYLIAQLDVLEGCIKTNNENAKKSKNQLNMGDNVVGSNYGGR